MLYPLSITVWLNSCTLWFSIFTQCCTLVSCVHPHAVSSSGGLWVCLRCPIDEFEFVRCLSLELRAICHVWDSLFVSLYPPSWAMCSQVTPRDRHSTFIMSLQPPCQYGDSLTVWVTPLGGTPISHLEACLSLSLSLCVQMCIYLVSVWLQSGTQSSVFTLTSRLQYISTCFFNNQSIVSRNMYIQSINVPEGKTQLYCYSW